MNTTVKIGIVGYSGKPFNTTLAQNILKSILVNLKTKYEDKNIELVSGYTNIGVPKIAYEIADDLGITTVGFSAKEALKVDCGLYPVKKEIIIGKHFGDESKDFIKYIDVLVRIGGGAQSLKEVDLFKKLHAQNDISNILFEEDID